MTLNVASKSRSSCAMVAEALTRSLAATTAYLMEGEVWRHKNRREIIVQVNEELADNGYPKVHVDNVSGRQDSRNKYRNKLNLNNICLQTLTIFNYFGHY